ncbi:hypothetical protein R2F61_08170 [Mollicutes bacterium LVI A0078]|nr:hypothetical protein RZE84_07945 [Mollicutes bacterium LVI A0075]WOO90689.1 hypothetical protein R2F61_08170 [Mollicutes bacterium LVI A0078]
MKLQYLAQVNKLLEDYDFQDKYKVLLELEEQISNLELNGQVNAQLLISEFGTPAEYVRELIGTYDLTKDITATSQNTSITDTDELMSATQTNLEHAQIDSTNKADDLEINSVDKNITDSSKSNDTSQNNTDTPAQSNDQSYKAKSENKAAKMPVKIIFVIITILFYLFGFIILAVTIVAALGLLMFIDAQTAISLFLAILFMLISIALGISFIKNLIYSIIDKNMKTVRLIITFILIIVFAFISKIMLSSTLETVSIFATTHMDAVQNLFYQYNVDTSNVDWSNLSLGEVTTLFGDVIRAVL